MQESNISVFGTMIRNEEIVDFMRLLNLVCEIFKRELTVVEIIPNGLIDENFRAVIEDDTQIAIRLAGQGTANCINRPGKRHNAGEITRLGTAPEICYYDPKTGSQTVKYIDAPTVHPVDFQTRDEVLVKAGAAMRHYHDSGLGSKTSSDPVAGIDEYKAILNEHSYRKCYEDWERMVEALKRIHVAYVRQPPRRVPCHNDVLAEGFTLQGKQMWIIDWEYNGMNDGYYDIACVRVENPLDVHYEDVSFHAYCGGGPSEGARARLPISKFLMISHWSTWSLVQICYGKGVDPYQEYGHTCTVQACSFLGGPSFSYSLTPLDG